MVTVSLSKPIKINDEECTSLNLDLESLTGRDLINATKEAKALGDTTIIAEQSKTYLAVVAAKAAKIPVDDIIEMPVKDFTQITVAVQDFLFS